MERFHWNWDVRAGGRTALARRYLRYKPRGLEAKRRLNGSMFGGRMGYLVNMAIEYGHERFVPVEFKMYKRVGGKEKKKKILQITQ